MLIQMVWTPTHLIPLKKLLNFSWKRNKPSSSSRHNSFALRGRGPFRPPWKSGTKPVTQNRVKPGIKPVNVTSRTTLFNKTQQFLKSFLYRHPVINNIWSQRYNHKYTTMFCRFRFWFINYKIGNVNSNHIKLRCFKWTMAF